MPRLLALLLILPVLAACDKTDTSSPGTASIAVNNPSPARDAKPSENLPPQANPEGAAPTQAASDRGDRSPVFDPRIAVTHEARFASWGLSCLRPTGAPKTDKERCSVSQIVAADPQGHNVLMGISFDYLASPTVPTMHFRFSPDAEARAGIGIKIDDKPEMRLAIGRCSKSHCEAAGRLTLEVIDLWASGRIAQVAFLDKGGQQVVVPVRLAGFGEALDALKQRTLNQ